jgi:hypothetical protein
MEKKHLKKQRLNLKFSFMDLVKWKINESTVGHGWIVKHSLYEGEVYYRVCMTEVSALGNNALQSIHNGSAFGKTIVDAIIEKHYGSKIFVKEQDLRKDFVKID